MNREPESRTTRESSGIDPKSPEDLLSRQDLTREEKVEMLRQWELDLREQMVAEEENMPAAGPVGVTLDEVLQALRSLGADSEFRDVTTKHG